jgi:putative ABC transport system permease protein
MRCLGASQGQLLQLHLLQFLLLGLAAVLLGCGIGYGGHWLLHLWLAELLATPLPAPSFVPAGQGAVVGLLLLFGFALPPLLQLKSVPTLRVFRRELDEAQSSLAGGYALGLICLMALMFWIAGDFRLGSYVVGGFTVALLLFAGIARGAVKLVRRLRKHGGFGWRYGVAGLERRSAASVVQIVALALGFLALLLLTVTRGDLLEAWQRAAPPDAPNRFVINIQPEQVEPVRRFFAGLGLGSAANPELSPMIRGRLVRINGRVIGADTFADERAKHLVDREFNLSWRADLPPGNQLPAGRWFSPADQGQGLASLEDGLAKTLGLVVGDDIEFVIAGATVKMRIVGLRKLNWDSMRVNFFVLTPPGVLERFPASYITSFHLDTGREEVVNQLIRDYPNLTVVDVGAILRQLQAVLDQVAHAVQFVFLFTLAAGVVVLYAALLSAFDERRHELAVMRALGASRRQLRQSLLAEFAAVGAVAGLIAAIGALAISQVLARQVFHFDVALNAWLPPSAALAGAGLVMAAGWLVARRLLDTAPLEALRSS